MIIYMIIFIPVFVLFIIIALISKHIKTAIFWTVLFLVFLINVSAECQTFEEDDYYIYYNGFSLRKDCAYQIDNLIIYCSDYSFAQIERAYESIKYKGLPDATANSKKVYTYYEMAKVADPMLIICLEATENYTLDKTMQSKNISGVTFENMIIFSSVHRGYKEWRRVFWHELYHMMHNRLDEKYKYNILADDLEEKRAEYISENF